MHLEPKVSTNYVREEKKVKCGSSEALEKNLEVDNKLEPERKVKLAQELGLQPRQVAVWFQNGRAHWKTNQLERDYGVLKANYDSFKLNYDTLQHDNDSLHKEIKDLRARLEGEKNVVNPVKEEEMACENNDNLFEEVLVTNKSFAAVNSLDQCDNATTDMNLVTTFFPDNKDGSSDSDSSAILNEDNNSPNAAISSTGVFGHQFMPSSSSSLNECFQFSSPSDPKTILGDAQKAYQPQFVKIEEHNFLKYLLSIQWKNTTHNYLYICNGSILHMD